MTSITETVRGKYAAVAAGSLSGDHAGVRAVAEAFGYRPEELASIPAEANMGLSCGNPTAFAHLRPGETVVDLGCGGGLDVLLAAPKVGPAGRAVGIDMTPEMIDRARRNAARAGAANAEFHLSTIDRIPLADGSADCIVSNCVINLAPDKAAVFREMYRVLKPGGRVAVSDIALKRPLPAQLAESVAAYVGCIAGAIPVSEYESALKSAGFAAVQIVDTGADLNAYAKVEGQAGCCSPTMETAPCCGPLQSAPETITEGCCTPAPKTAESPVHKDLSELLRNTDVNDYAASVRVYAVKPSAEGADR
jgi:SAM-dependent methyltransferase